ncbi:MAG: FtsW/RodA/SpoVE family cell cycle protein, partial [Oscillospiraceae bacterium]
MAKSNEKVKGDRIKRAGSDRALLIVTLILVVFGLIMMLSASFANAYYMWGDSYHFIKNQAVYAVLGIVAMFVISNINYRILHKFAWPIFIVSYILLAITLFMPKLNGARRWIIIGTFTFQPSEIVKFAVIAVFAHMIATKPERMKEFKYGYIYPLMILGAIAAIMLNQTHLSGTILICLVGCVMMYVGGTRIKWFALTGVAVVPLGVAFIFLAKKMEYSLTRIQIWQNPFLDRTGDG